MRSWLASWRVAIRHGRRHIGHARGRAALVAVMVGAPVLLTTALLAVTASNDLTPAESIAGELGSAQASLVDVGAPLTQTPDGVNVETRDDIDSDVIDDRTLPQMQSRLERLLGEPVAAVSMATMTISRADRGYATEVRGIDTSSPLTRGMFSVDEGRAPRAADEILVNHDLAGKGLTVGRRADLDGRAVIVVGVGRPDASVRGGNEPQAVTVATDGTPSWLVGGAPIGWDRVRELNAAGVSVVSRAVLEDPPPPSEVPGDTVYGGEGGAERAVFVIIATSVMLEIVLLASPAFAVGVRQQRRELALIAATGASPRQLRRIVLGQALVLGVATSVLGAALGLGLAASIVRFGPGILPAFATGPFQVQWPLVGLAVALGAVAALAASSLPARQASRQDVATVLAGRRGQVRSGRGWPVVGVLLVAAGIAACFTLGIRSGGELVVGASTIAVVLGAVMLMPTVIGLVGLTAGRLPLPLRLAVRDASRQRSRSAPAIAAIMASVAGITAIAIASSSDFAQSRDQYETEAALGRTVINAEADEMTRAQAIARRATGTDYLPITSGVSDDTTTTYATVLPDDPASGPSMLVATAEQLRSWGISVSVAAGRALDAGSALMDPSNDAVGSTTRLTVTKGERTVRGDRVPLTVTSLRWGTSQDAGTVGTAIISPATAREHGIPTEVGQAVSPASAATLTPDETDALREQLSVVGFLSDVRTERGFEESFTLVLVALFAAGGIAVLIGTWTATALALSDARPDLATLAAVGAAPRTRRWMAGAQTIVLAALGAVVGVAVGFAPGLAITWPLTGTDYRLDGVSQEVAPTIDVPWLQLVALVVLVPLVAAGVAMLVARGKLPLVRRLAQ